MVETKLELRIGIHVSDGCRYIDIDAVVADCNVMGVGPKALDRMIRGETVGKASEGSDSKVTDVQRSVL